MRDAIEQIYQIELEVKKGLINNEQDMDALYIRHLDSYHRLLEKNNNLKSKFDYGFDIFSTVRVPVGILKYSSMYSTSGKIKNFDRNNINSFFWDQFGIDVSSVDVIEVQNMPDHAEAYASPCNVNEHYIAIPDSKSNAFFSYDLLVHEIAHTVEFTERRKNSNPAHIFSFPLLSEAIAHYYQIIYMLKHSSEEERLGMLASITEAYLFYRCMRIMCKVAPKDKKFDPNKILNDSEFVDFIKAYQGTNVVSNFFERYHNQDYYAVYNQIHAQRLGVFLAFNFIKYKLDITELFHTRFPTGETISLEGLIKQTKLKPKVLFNFSKMEETITKFVEGNL